VTDPNLFDIRPGMLREDDYATSVEAAKTVVHKQGTIRAKVEQYSIERAAYGFIDDDLRERFGLHHPESSFRKRRTELAQDGVILNSGQSRPNRNGDQATVWVHKDYASPTATPVDGPRRREKIERPRLGGGISPVSWLRMIAKMDRANGATMRAHEAEMIADWIVKNGLGL
jgi:hypothetical protein